MSTPCSVDDDDAVSLEDFDALPAVTLPLPLELPDDAEAVYGSLLEPLELEPISLFP